MPSMLRANWCANTLVTLLFSAIAGWFVYLNVLIALRMGLSGGDDGYFALVARYFAEGKGYGSPISSTEFEWFSAHVSMGPALIIPISGLVWLFGPRDWIFGLATFCFFALQLAAGGVVLSRRFNAGAVIGCGTLFLVLLMLISRNGWYFGSFLGEAPALGWLLVGTALLVSGTNKSVAASGLCFALACLTKQISFFAVAGIIGGYSALSIFRVGVKRIAVPISLLCGAAFVPLALWEIGRVTALGLDNYHNLLRETAEHAVAPENGIGERISTFAAIFGEIYAPPLLVTFVVICAMATNLFGRRSAPYIMLVVVLWCGMITYFAFVLFVAPLWQRYFWIGLAIGCFGVCAPMLQQQSRFRPLAVLVVLATVVALGLDRTVLAPQFLAATAEGSEARAQVVRFIDDRKMPLVGQTSPSLFDVLALRAIEGEWVRERDIDRYRQRDFLALINDNFTTKEGVHARFFLAVTQACRLEFQAAHFHVYRCGDEFWSKYDNLDAMTQLPREILGVFIWLG